LFSVELLSCSSALNLVRSLLLVSDTTTGPAEVSCEPEGSWFVVADGEMEAAASANDLGCATNEPLAMIALVTVAGDCAKLVLRSDSTVTSGRCRCL
jgi:hypothetical protein